MAPVSTLPALGFVDRMQRLGLDFEKEVDGRGWAAFLKGGFNKEVEILLSFWRLLKLIFFCVFFLWIDGWFLFDGCLIILLYKTGLMFVGFLNLLFFFVCWILFKVRSSNREEVKILLDLAWGITSLLPLCMHDFECTEKMQLWWNFNVRNHAFLFSHAGMVRMLKWIPFLEFFGTSDDNPYIFKPETWGHAWRTTILGGFTVSCSQHSDAH